MQEDEDPEQTVENNQGPIKQFIPIEESSDDEFFNFQDDIIEQQKDAQKRKGVNEFLGPDSSIKNQKHITPQG